MKSVLAILTMALVFLVSPVTAMAGPGGTTPTYQTVNMGIACNSRMNPCPSSLHSLPNVTSVVCTLYTCMVTYADCGPLTNSYVPFYNAATGLCQVYPNLESSMLCFYDTDCGPSSHHQGVDDVSVTIHFYCDKVYPFILWGTCNQEVVEAECCANGVGANGYCL